jgi:4-amino-4-deoxy-L-arabinose transferase-like glycosyltransferase
LSRSSVFRNALATLLVLAVVYFCFFSRLGALGFLGPDEPRYAWVARAMAQTHDWITPRLYGRPWFEKPILYYWAAAAAFRGLGVSEWAARLPSAIAALVATLALVWAAFRLYGLATAWAVGLILPTCIGVFGFARAATMDMLFSGALVVALVAAYWAGSKQGSPHFPALAVFGAFLGLATLAKGPAAIVLAGGSIILWALVTLTPARAGRLFHPLVILAFALVAVPWYALCAMRNPGFVRSFLLEQNFQRYLTPVYQHVRGGWFFGPVILLGLAPWSIVLAGVALKGVGKFLEGGWRDEPAAFFACWATFPILFFSFSQSKLPGYVLPSLPPLALLVANFLAAGAEADSWLARWLLAGVGLTWVGLALSAGHWLGRLPSEWVAASHAAIVATVSASAAIGILVAVLSAARKPRAALLLSSALAAALVAAINGHFAPRLDPYLSARAAARLSASLPATAAPAAYRLRRDWLYGLDFYLDRELTEWSPAAKGPGWLYTNDAGLAELHRLGRKPVVLGRVSPEAVLVQIAPGKN